MLASTIGRLRERLAAGFNLPPSGKDAYKQADRPQLALTKFVCYLGSDKFRLNRAGKPTPDLLIHHDNTTTPAMRGLRC